MEKVIEIKNLTKSYKNLKAVDDLSLMYIKVKYQDFQGQMEAVNQLQLTQYYLF